MSPDPALVVRFRRDFEDVLGRSPSSDDPIALAVSGGADSMAMLALGVAAFPGRVIAATVDHRLREGSADEAAMVKAWCDSQAVAHATLTIDLPPERGDNLQSWARQERYTLLRRWTVQSGSDILATAHHADDQAETFLMRAARGAGLSGLAAIRANQSVTFAMKVKATGSSPDEMGWLLHEATISLVRPVIGWRRHELRLLATSMALPFVDDPSNADDRFDRARFRDWLAKSPWLDPVKIGRSAHYLAETDGDLRALGSWLWQARALPCTPYEARFDIGDLPREVRRRLARMAIESVLTVNGTPSDWTNATNIEPLLDALDAGSSATQAGILASATGTIWHFREAPPRRSH